MNTKLYMLSLGPGDVEHLTIKAANVLRSVDAICIPTKSPDNGFEKSIGFSIVQKALAYFGLKKTLIPVYTPMRFLRSDWEAEAEIVLDTCKKYDTVAFVTLGDAAIYSSVYYLLDIIARRDPHIYTACEVVPGVTSFSVASAKIKKPLCVGDEALRIVPIAPRNEVQTTTIYMRPSLGMQTDSLGEGEFYTFENLDMPNECITYGKIAKVKRYMTLFIRYRKRKRR